MINESINLDNNLLGDGYSSIIYTVKTGVQQAICKINFEIIFIYFLIPLIIGLILLILIIYKDTLMKKFYRFFQMGGYIKIMYILPNKHIKIILKKLDNYNIFEFKNKKYSLEKMYNFIIGYDKYNFPVFMYDYSFILPLIITREKVTNEIKKQIKDVQQMIDIKEQQDKISAISMRLEPHILKIVYKKRLLSDLYSISGEDKLKHLIFWAIVIIIGFSILYYTGILEYILQYLGFIEVAK